jgi:hypothetical protein
LAVNIDAGSYVIVTRKATEHPRNGWADASRALAARGDGALRWPKLID